MTRYIDAEEMRLALGAESPDDDTLLEMYIDSAQKQIEEHCRRTFIARTETRSYNQWYSGLSPDGRLLFLDDDLLSVTTLTNGDSAVIASTAYWLEPRGLPPYSVIRLMSSKVWTFNTDASITIAGSWGYATTPPANILQAMRRLVGYMYHQRGAQVFDVTAEPGAGVIIVPKGIPEDVKLILEPFRRDTYT